MDFFFNLEGETVQGKTEMVLNGAINMPGGSLSPMAFFFTPTRHEPFFQPSLGASLFLLYISLVGHLVDLHPVKRRVKHPS